MNDPVSGGRRGRGRLYEQLAEEYLLAQGYQLLARSWSVRRGEIDLIMSQDETVVFVEVRTRSSLDWGHPAETINVTKQRKIIGAARHWLVRERPGQIPDCRFDVITVLTPANSAPVIEHFPDAFRCQRDSCHVAVRPNLVMDGNPLVCLKIC